MDPDNVTPTNQQQVPTGLPQPGQVPPTAPTPAPAPIAIPPTGHTLPAPAPAPAATVPTPAPASAPTGQIADFAGDLVDDPYAKVGLTYIESAIAGTSVDLNRAFAKAAEYGDINLIDEAYLQEVLGDKAPHVVAQAKALFEYSAQKQTQALQEVYQSVGGEAQLKQAAAYFNKAASDEQRRTVAYLLDSGDPVLMKAGAQQIVQLASSAGVRVQAGAQPLGQAGALQGLSHADYIKAISERNLPADKYEQLRQQRLIGRQQGL